MSTIIKSLPAGTINVGHCHLVRGELAAKHGALGATCLGVTIDGGEVTDSLIMSFDQAPNEAALDAAIAAYPESPSGMGSSFAAVANVPTLVRPILLAPGEHVGLKITLAVSLAGVTASDCIIEASVPVWCNANGTIDFERPKSASSSRITGVAIEVTVQQLNGIDAGVAISYSQRAGGTVTVLYLEVLELYRKTIP